MAVSNQKTITTKSAKKDKNNYYCVINLEALEVAMNLLKPNTFKLWLYIAKNQNDYTFDLSCVDACRFCGFKGGTYHTAVQELIDCGYLKQTTNNHYDFFEKLPEEEKITVSVKKEEFVF